jgi:Flp pilus assembly protein TadG
MTGRATAGAWLGCLARPRPHLGRRGSVSVIFAVSLVPMIIASEAAIDFSRLAAGRANLQEAVDDGALSGAAAYSVNAVAAQTKAIVMATSSTCETTVPMPAGFALSGTGTTSCGAASGAGPTVTTQIGGFQTGIPGIVPSQCSATNPVVGGSVTCGFIVTVTAHATMTTMIPAYFGGTITISATGIAANPFVNIGNAFTTQLNGSARYNDSLWVYPLLLNANGDPDYTTNRGAIPGLISGVYPADASASGCASLTSCGNAGTPAGVNCLSSGTACGTTPPSGCTDSPLQFVCGQFTMLASTFYNNGNCADCYPLGAGHYPEIKSGVIQNPQAPPGVITATTPLGIAYESHSGGDVGYSFSGSAANGCNYPGATLYNTVSQAYSTADNTFNGSATAGNQGMDWPKVTRWFYSSYLANGWPPSTGEIESESYGTLTSPTGIHYNVRIPSLGSDSSNTWSPTLAACALPAANGASYDLFMTTTFPTSGADNGALFIIQQPSGAAYILPADTGYAGVYYTPQATPGAQYAALSCQAFGQYTYTFYWNDMGGNAAYPEDIDYGNGTIRVTCTSSAFIKLIG